MNFTWIEDIKCNVLEGWPVEVLGCLLAGGLKTWNTRTIQSGKRTLMTMMGCGNDHNIWKWGNIWQFLERIAALLFRAFLPTTDKPIHPVRFSYSSIASRWNININFFTLFVVTPSVTCGGHIWVRVGAVVPVQGVSGELWQGAGGVAGVAGVLAPAPRVPRLSLDLTTMQPAT